MVELVYVGLPGVSHVDPPLGQLEPDQLVTVEDEVAERLLLGENFALSQAEVDKREAEATAQKKKAKPAAQPDTPPQED